MAHDADAIVVGAGLAGLVAAGELLDHGRKVILVDQEGEQSLGGQAFWSFGGLFLVDTPEQRRMGISDSLDLAWRDWQDTAGFDRDADAWPRRWAEAYVEWAAVEKRRWIISKGLRLFPVVGWAERGAGSATGPGNTVPRFHIVWGTGPGLLEPFVHRIRQGEMDGLLDLRTRHRVDDLVVTDGAATGVAGAILASTDVERGARSSREVVGEFDLSAPIVIVTSGGIGGNQDLVRTAWPDRLGAPPDHMITGVPHHVDGRMQMITHDAGASLINSDRMWHYVEGVQNHSPIWPDHGIRILPGPSSLWFDAVGNRLPVPLYPGYDTLGTLAHLRTTGHDHSWFILNQEIIQAEFSLSGSEQNPDLTGRSIRGVARRAMSGGKAPAPVEAFKEHGADFVVRDNLQSLVAAMNDLTDAPLLDFDHVRTQVQARDRDLTNDFGKDLQIAAIERARKYRGDKLIRTAAPHRILDPRKGPLIAVKLHILTRKSLGGLETDLFSRVLRPGGDVFPGLYAAGEVAGFGGGGVHGYRSLEGTFLGGCLFSGRIAGHRAAFELAD